jgi:hypothetical protein
MGKIVSRGNVTFDADVTFRYERIRPIYVRFLPNTSPAIAGKYGKIIIKGKGPGNKERFIEVMDEELKEYLYCTSVRDYHLIDSNSKEAFVIKMKYGDV